MPEKMLVAILLRQYERSWRMVEEAVNRIPPDTWATGDVEYLTPARTAYHIVETAEFYSGETSDDFPWGHRFGGDWEGMAQEDLQSQEDVLAYLADVKPKVEAWLQGLGDAGLLAADSAFPWTGGCVLDRAFYLLRHTHHHVGELWSEIKRRGQSLPDWY